MYEYSELFKNFLYGLPLIYREAYSKNKFDIINPFFEKYIPTDAEHGYHKITTWVIQQAKLKFNEYPKHLAFQYVDDLCQTAKWAYIFYYNWIKGEVNIPITEDSDEDEKWLNDNNKYFMKFIINCANHYKDDKWLREKMIKMETYDSEFLVPIFNLIMSFIYKDHLDYPDVNDKYWWRYEVLRLPTSNVDIEYDKEIDEVVIYEKALRRSGFK